MMVEDFNNNSYILIPKQLETTLGIQRYDNCDKLCQTTEPCHDPCENGYQNPCSDPCEYSLTSPCPDLCEHSLTSPCENEDMTDPPSPPPIPFFIKLIELTSSTIKVQISNYQQSMLKKVVWEIFVNGKSTKITTQNNELSLIDLEPLTTYTIQATVYYIDNTWNETPLEESYTTLKRLLEKWPGWTSLVEKDKPIGITAKEFETFLDKLILVTENLDITYPDFDEKYNIKYPIIGDFISEDICKRPWYQFKLIAEQYSINFTLPDYPKQGTSITAEFFILLGDCLNSCIDYINNN